MQIHVSIYRYQAGHGIHACSPATGRLRQTRVCSVREHLLNTLPGPQVPPLPPSFRLTTPKG